MPYAQVKRVAKQIFDHLESTASTSISVYVSFLENQGSKCFDLLHNRASVMLREDGQGGVLCVGLSEVHCNTYDDLMSTFSIGNDLRLTAATSSNDFSSRSHAICDIILRQDCSEDSLEASLESNREHGSIVGSLRIVDLAGSERVQDTSFHSSDRLRETKEINTSLSCLKDCIRALYLNQKKSSNSGKGTPGHIPFRNSKLTMILRDSFQDSTTESSTKLFTAFIAHACPVASCASHTQNTLDYASAILATSRAAKERSRFVGPEKWTTDQVMEWAGTLDGGRLKPLAGAVRYSGKALSVVWRGELVDNFVARGGSVADADFVYDEFRALLKQSKAAANKSKGALSNHALEATRGASEPVAPFSFSGLGSDPASN
jgi:kinesin family protein 2/24